MTTGNRRSRAGRVAATAVVAAALGVAGCGGKSDGDATSATSATATTVTVAAAGDAAPTRRLRTLRFGSQLAAPKPGARPTGFAPGAQMVFTGMLFQPGGKAAIGRSQGSCTRTAAGAGEVFQCLLSFVLRDGTIYAQSTASSQGPADGAITGGTGSYAYSRGTFRYKANGTPRVDLTLRLGS